MRTTPEHAHASLHEIAHSAGRQGRPQDIAWTLSGMGVLAGLGDRFELYRSLSREWAAGRVLYEDTQRWQDIADADWFDYCAQQAAGL